MDALVISVFLGGVSAWIYNLWQRVRRLERLVAQQNPSNSVRGDHHGPPSE